eukprot:CAMPEP_0118684356 /NCGR_PEP_ID=MMETSP0800-20121206/6596_1 /TAXON_ID=210618 ORGANISM="Striatella unipunctata, Strain CCMP2910" /NCGR_SAMPLE_ID=MMETSP0800 /ASSEMBLY_ACC=CAM_ASM_000638 /LENGTH=715 /DNA_ID=CAMNT_0006581049 /DNA_START=525 /DNA_END=2672 /DNA_ORIENTATION=+
MFLKNQDVIEFTRSQIEGLRSRRIQDSNYSTFFQLYAPPKEQALAYLDNDGDRPDRYARVTVYRGAADTRDVMIYKVGPLRNGRVLPQEATVTPLLADGEIPWAQRTPLKAERPLLLYAREALFLWPLVRSITGGICLGGLADRTNITTFLNCSVTETKFNLYFVNSLTSIDATSDLRIFKVQPVLIPVAGGSKTLQPLPISYKYVEDPDLNETEWATFGFQYCGQGTVDFAEDLLFAFQEGFLQNCTMDPDFAWASLNSERPFRKLSNVPGPTAYDQVGRRYTVLSSGVTRRDTVGDGGGHKVSWMDWGFHVSSDPIYGMVLRNIKFKDVRIAYEISLQEYSSAYSSAGTRSEMFFFDSASEPGSSFAKLRLGVDCPANAMLLAVADYDSGFGGSVIEDSICIFEESTGEPLWHFEDRGIERTVLRVRSITSIGSNEYIPTFTFMPDGTFDMKIDVGGYMYGSYAFALESRNVDSPTFGQRISATTNGLLHDQLIAIKADLDVIGRNNTLVTGTVAYGTYTQATGSPKPSSVTYDAVRYMDTTRVSTESAVNVRDVDLISVQSTETNAWGAARSYDVEFHKTVSKQKYPMGHPIGRARPWANSNLAVTLHDDKEAFCSYNSGFQVARPIASFDLASFQNGESVAEKDLVLWLMVGKEHYPKSEDIPVVSNFGTGFSLKPRNMFDRAAYSDLREPDDVGTVCNDTIVTQCMRTTE